MTLYSDLQALGLTANQSQDLGERKLVSTSSMKGVALYKLLAPTRLLEEPQEKERLAKSVIQEIGLLSKKFTSGQEIVVYEGLDEFRRQVKRCFMDMKPGGITRYLGISPRWHEIVGPELESELIGIQNEKKFKLLALAHSITPEQKEYTQKTNGLTRCRTSMLIASDTSETEILEDRICIRSFLEPFFVVEIIHTELAKNHQNYFDFLWKNSK
jgi:hypothetical protein